MYAIYYENGIFLMLLDHIMSGWGAHTKCGGLSYIYSSNKTNYMIIHKSQTIYSNKLCTGNLGDDLNDAIRNYIYMIWLAVCLLY